MLNICWLFQSLILLMSDVTDVLKLVEESKMLLQYKIIKMLK